MFNFYIYSSSLKNTTSNSGSLWILTMEPEGIHWTTGQWNWYYNIKTKDSYLSRLLISSSETDIIILKLRIVTYLSPLDSLFSSFSFFFFLSSSVMLTTVMPSSWVQQCSVTRSNSYIIEFIFQIIIFFKEKIYYLILIFFFIYGFP